MPETLQHLSSVLRKIRAALPMAGAPTTFTCAGPHLLSNTQSPRQGAEQLPRQLGKSSKGYPASTELSITYGLGTLSSGSEAAEHFLAENPAPITGDHGPTWGLLSAMQQPPALTPSRDSPPATPVGAQRALSHSGWWDRR